MTLADYITKHNGDNRAAWADMSGITEEHFALIERFLDNDPRGGGYSGRFAHLLENKPFAFGTAVEITRFFLPLQSSKAAA